MGTISLKDYRIIRKKLASIIKGSIFEGHVFFVGGCVRDLMLKRRIKDIDVVVDLLNGGMELAHFLKDKGYVKDNHIVEYPVYGVASFTFQADDILPYAIPMEIVHTRKEIYNHKNRNPITAYGTIEEDALRRDLTINALYHNVSTDKITSPLGDYAFSNLKYCTLDTCDEAIITFKDDPLRVLRVFRFYATLKPINGFWWSISSGIKRAIELEQFDLSILEWERINAEIEKILKSGNASDTFAVMRICLRHHKPNDNNWLDKGLFSTSANEFDDIFGKCKSLTIGDVLPLIMYNYSKVATWENHRNFEANIGNELRKLRISNKEFKKIRILYELLDDWEYGHVVNGYITITLRELAYKYRDKEILKTALLYARAKYNYNVPIKDFVFFLDAKLPLNGNDLIENLSVRGEIVGKLIDFCNKKVVERPFLFRHKDKLLKMAKRRAKHYGIK